MLVDTAGIRRKRRQRQGIEYYSELRALAAAERADVALVLVDASEGLVDQDLAVADIARKAQCSTIVVLSKWDITRSTLEDVRPRLESRLRQRPPIVTVSREDRPRHRAPARPGRAALREAHQPYPDPELNRFLAELREAREPPSRNGQPPQPALRHPGADAAAALSLLRQRSRPDHARLRLLGREPAARALRARRRAGLDRLREARSHRKAAVRVDAAPGAWGTAFSSLLAARGHDVTLACRDPEQARAIEETGHNPRHLPAADLSGVSATTVDDPSLAGADLHVIAVPSQAFAEVVRALPGAAPVLSLTKGLDPETGGAYRSSSSAAARRCSRGRTSPRRSPTACPQRR